MIGLGGFEIKLAYEKKYFKSLKYLFSRDDWSISNQRKVNSGIWNQVCLELIEINIESSIKSQRCSDGGDNLGDEPGIF